MNPLTLYLVAGIAILLFANAILSFLPKKKRVQVAFIPPSPAPLISEDFSARFDSHAQSVSQKINHLFARMEELERRVQGLEGNPFPESMKWAETVPVRARKK
jgi:hypothetical protein